MLLALLFCGGQQPDHLSGPIRRRDRSIKEAEKLPRLFASASNPSSGRIRSRQWRPISRKSCRGWWGHEPYLTDALVDEAQSSEGTFSYLLLPVFVDGVRMPVVGIEVARSLCVGVGAGRRQVSAPSGGIHRYFEWNSRRRMRTRSYPQNGFLPPGQGSPSWTRRNKQEAQHSCPVAQRQDLGSKPLHELTCLVSYLKDKLKVPPSAHRIVGPRTSGTLRAMLEELKPTAATPKPVASASLSGAQFYSSWATAADPILLDEPLVSGWPKPVEGAVHLWPSS